MSESQQLEATAYEWDGDDVAVTLERDGADHAVVELRVVTEPAPCWGHEQRLELLDIEGDGEGVEAWVARETETVLALWNGKRGRSSWLLN